MINTTTYNYILIGLLLRHLQSLPATAPASQAKKNLATLIEKLDENGFVVSRAFQTGNNYAEMVADVKAIDDDKPIGTLSSRISENVRTLEQVLFAEALTKRVYVLPTRRFNSDALLSDPSKLFKKDAFAKLDAIAQVDLASAGRCILFGEATAAAFHLLRATESVLTTYYCHHRRQKRLTKPMWSNMLEQLKAKTRNKPPASLLDTLDLIRTVYRNPTQHPTLTYEIDGAQDLLGVCIDVIGKMADEL